MFASIASSPSEISNLLLGEDVLATRDALIALGNRIETEGIFAHIFPAETWIEPNNPLDCGNSGTTMRLLAGLLASRELSVDMIGDTSLSRRPMGRIATPLRLMGAEILGDTPPLRICGGALRGIEYETPVASAQIKSCILLAGLRADGVTRVKEPMPSRDHTERMLLALGSDIVERDGWIEQGPFRPEGFQMIIPGDISSAAFWMILAARPGSQITIQGVGINPTRSGILDVFESAGIQVLIENVRDELGEPVADLTVFGGESKAFEISGPLVPRLIDEIPVLALLATQCEGTTVIRDAKEMRVKETDRIATTTELLRGMGANVEPTEDGMIIQGPTPLHPCAFDASHDHRLAMTAKIAEAWIGEPMKLTGTESILTSYPAFETHLRTVTSQ